MNRNVTAISLAAYAGASCLLLGHTVKAAITITETRVASNVTFANGTYDVVVLDLTALTGQDATSGHNDGNTQDPEVLALMGTFDVIGGAGTPEMAMIGTPSNQAANSLSAPGSTYGGPGTLHSSYIAFPSNVGTTTIAEVGPNSKTTGNASSISDTWYGTPTGAGNGNVGGIEPGKDPQSLTVADGGSDPYANNGMLAEFLVNPGAIVTFAGAYIDYGYPTGNNVALMPITGSNKIISLATGGAPTGTAPNGYGNAALGTLNVSTGSPVSLSFSGVGQRTGYVAITGENPAATSELYALQLDLNGSPISSTQLSILDQIIADITASNSDVTSVTRLAGSPYAGLFPGYDLLITTSGGSASPYFAFDFSTAPGDFTDEDPLLGAVTVTGIAAVPEPAPGIVAAAVCLLLGRRQNHRMPDA